MPRYYCDYCDIFLTHDSPKVRRDHNAGWRHCAQVRAHFLAANLERMARHIGEVIKDYELRNELVPVPAPISIRHQARIPFPLPQSASQSVFARPPRQ
jgi:hypothetical protein